MFPVPLSLPQPLLPSRLEASTYLWRCQLPSAIALPWSWHTIRHTSLPWSPWSRRTAPKIKVRPLTSAVALKPAHSPVQMPGFQGGKNIYKFPNKKHYYCLMCCHFQVQHNLEVKFTRKMKFELCKFTRITFVCVFCYYILAL